jgi:hypothetical protein
MWYSQDIAGKRRGVKPTETRHWRNPSEIAWPATVAIMEELWIIYEKSMIGDSGGNTLLT